MRKPRPTTPHVRAREATAVRVRAPGLKPPHAASSFRRIARREPPLCWRACQGAATAAAPANGMPWVLVSWTAMSAPHPVRRCCAAAVTRCRWPQPGGRATKMAYRLFLIDRCDVSWRLVLYSKRQLPGGWLFVASPPCSAALRTRQRAMQPTRGPKRRPVAAPSSDHKPPATAESHGLARHAGCRAWRIRPRCSVHSMKAVALELTACIGRQRYDQRLALTSLPRSSGSVGDEGVQERRSAQMSSKCTDVISDREAKSSRWCCMGTIY